RPFPTLYMFLERAPPRRPVTRTADQRNWKYSFPGRKTQSLRSRFRRRKQPKDSRTAARHHGHGSSRPDQFLLQCGESAVLPEDHAFKIVRGSLPHTASPDLRLETIYFILLRFACQ